jgi:precorrin isomerase
MRGAHRSSSRPSRFDEAGQGRGGSANARPDYLRDPAAIYRESFAIIRREARLDRLPPDVAEIAVRLVHACGMTDIVEDLVFTGDVAERARAALSSGAPILCDSAMVAAGVIRARLPAANKVICTLADPRVTELAASLGTTRSAAAVELWAPHLAGAVVAIGNAPTALFHLLERLQQSDARPAAIFAFPVGFVGAAESKQALIDAALTIPCLTLKGRRGGSALAAAAVNALMPGDPP